ncbi:hypothetical protein [Bdellovibrio sp. HCB-110]|uniref:hypothetical protein n=1 Tax=Bdellovibrio sp. HCB-110 TaxID=3391182 RepID=UPI0039B36B6F
MKTAKSFKSRWKSLVLSAVMITSGSIPVKAQNKKANEVFTLNGIVVTSLPIRDAEIRIYRNGSPIKTIRNATDKNGYFKVELSRAEVPANSSLGIQAVGGSTGLEPFNGDLVTNVKTTTATSEFVHLNIATTLSGYLQGPTTAMTIEQANARVKKFLKLPPTMNLGFDFENPKLTLFSARKFDAEAQTYSGYRPFFARLFKEMAADPNSTHPFPADQVNSKNLQFDPAMWAAEKLLAAVGGKVGSEVFAALAQGVGIPNNETAILSKLDLVLNNIATIQAQLHEIELDISDYSYSQRATELLKGYNQYALIIDELKQLDLRARANADKQDEKEKQSIIAAAIEKRNALINLYDNQKSNFVVDAYTEFSGDKATVTTLGSIFAKNQYLKRTMIDKSYFDMTDMLIAQYRSYQANVIAIVTDAKRQAQKPSAESDFAAAKKYLVDDEIVSPDGPIFRYPDYVTSVRAGTMMYDRATNLLWDLQYQAFKDCAALLNNNGTAGAWRTPGFDESVSILDHTGSRGMAWQDAMKKIGFKSADVDATPMVAFGCNMAAYSSGIVTMVNWFGSETSGPWQQYYDTDIQFYRVAKQKNVQGAIYKTMKVRSL